MRKIFLVPALAGSLLAFDGWARASETEDSVKADVKVMQEAADPSVKQERPAAALVRINVSFKLDPRITRGLYMGDSWVSPPTYTRVGEGKTCTVEARAHGLDSRGRPVKISPKWIPADPEMVTVTPSEGNEVKITVQRAGESKLRVASEGVSKELGIKAAYQDNSIRVEIIQEAAREPRRAGPGADPGATVAAPSPDPGGAAAAPDAPVLRDEKAKNSYALGMGMGGRLKGQFPELDPDLVSRGLRDALTGDKPLLTEGELKAALMALQSDVRTRQAQAQKQLGEKNKKDGEAFLAENKTKEGVVTLQSGLQYKILKAGDGKKPTADDTVVCHYRGTLIDGKEFDSSQKRKNPATFALKRVIKGWSEALQLMPVGSKWQLFVPTNLAYGARGSRGGIGPNATLVFEVELLSIRVKPQTAQRRESTGQKPAKHAPAQP